MFDFLDFLTNLFPNRKNSEPTWQQEKQNLLSMPLDEKRELYTVTEYKTLADIPTWKSYSTLTPLSKPIPRPTPNAIDDSLNTTLADKISVFRGDITTLEVDVIVNAANHFLFGGRGVDGDVHRAAGLNLREECRTLKGCETGQAKITGGYALPAKYVIHTVGPIGEYPELLERSYRACLELMRVNKLRTIAFPCISAGVHGYPVERAAHVAAYEVRKHLEKHCDAVDRVIFCVFVPEDEPIYQGILQSYFPV